MNSLKDSIVDQELGCQRCQQSDTDSQAEAAAGSVERPPQANGECRQSQRQLDVVGKVHFLTEVEVKGLAVSDREPHAGFTQLRQSDVVM